MGGLFAVLAAFMTARAEHHGGRETPEAVTGWVFLVSTSVAILLMSHNPLGMEEINRLLSSTIIGARRQDVWVFLGLTALTGLVLSLKYRSVVLIALEPDMARIARACASGCGTACLSAWLGIVIGFSIHVSGVVYAFASLVLPALIAKNPRPNRQKPVLPGTLHLARHRRHCLRPRQPLRLPAWPGRRRLPVRAAGRRLAAARREAAVALRLKPLSCVPTVSAYGFKLPVRHAKSLPSTPIGGGSPGPAPSCFDKPQQAQGRHRT